MLAPLDSYIKSTKYNTAAFYPNLLNAFKVGGKTYGLPKDWSPLAMEINKAALLKVHMKAPTTWAQLTTIAQAMAKQNVVPGGKPICLSADWARLLPFVFQNKARSRRSPRRRPPRPSTTTSAWSRRASRRRLTSSAPTGAAPRSASRRPRSSSRATGCSRT